MEEQDRLSRQGIRATLDVIGRFLDAGMAVHITEKSLVIRTEEDLDNLAIVVPTVVNSSAANEYTKKLSERVLSARASEREKARATGPAITAKVPSWLKAEIGQKAVLIPDRADTVRRIFELAGMGLGAKKIVRKLEEEKRAPFANGKKQGQSWNPEFIQKTLRNRAVLGEYQPHKLLNGKRVPVGEPIPDFYPAVVTPSEWNAARQAVEAKTRFRKDGRPGFAGGLELIKSGTDPELRLRLKAEIRKRVWRIEVTFDDEEIDPAGRLDYCALVHFVNGSLRTVAVKDGKALLAKVTLDPETLRSLGEAA